MSPSQATLASSDDADIKSFLEWVTQHRGVEAFPVYDYIQLPVSDRHGSNTMIGTLNGITVQWDIHDQLIIETPEGEPNIYHPVADGAVHVRPGGTITATAAGFDVDNPPILVDKDPDTPKVDPALLAAVLEAVRR